MRSMRSIAVANQKGGVGKTTTSVNLAAGLARSGKRVCLVDLDPQAHATLHAGVMPGDYTVSAYDVLVSGQPLAAAMVPAGENLTVVPSHIDLSAVEMALAGRSGREGILRQRIEADPRCTGVNVSGGTGGVEPFDYMVIDCPPSLGILSLNAMAARFGNPAEADDMESDAKRMTTHIFQHICRRIMNDPVRAAPQLCFH